MKMFFGFLVLVLSASCGSDSSGNKGGDPCVDCNPQAGSAEVQIDALDGPLSENDSPVTTTIKLKRQPTADVTVSIISRDPSTLVVDPGDMVFTTANWSASQVLTLSPVDDKIDEADQEVEVEFALSSEDPGFSGKNVNSLFVTVTDDDELPSIVVESEDGFDLLETGEPLELEITLSAQPDGDVLVPIDVDDEDEASVDTDRLTFTALDWNLPQKIVLTGNDDLEADGDIPFNLVLGPVNSTDPLFNLEPQLVAFTSIDGVCGNGLQDGSEDCDGESASTVCPYGEPDCMVCGDTCELIPGTSSGFCGDNQIQAGEEACDEPTQACAYGEMSCETCSNCQEVAGQLSGFCGDGTVQAANEECDGSTCCTDCVKDVVCQAECLIFSQYNEGSGLNKGFELYNCEGSAINLNGYVACLVANGDTNCGGFLQLNGNMNPGAVITVCNSQAQGSPSCDISNDNVTSFNGDDRLLVFLDLNSNNSHDSGEPIADAFGQTAVFPSDSPWSDRSFQRCNFTQYDGVGLFDWTTYFEGFTSSFVGFGQPPSETCP